MAPSPNGHIVGRLQDEEVLVNVLEFRRVTDRLGWSTTMAKEIACALTVLVPTHCPHGTYLGQT